MSTNNKTLIGVFSGLAFSGKSYYLKWILRKPEFRQTPLIAIDPIRRELFGDTVATKTQHLFKNEAARWEIKKQLISRQPKVLLTEMVMLTRDGHQKPFVAMLADTQALLHTIQQEKTSTPDLHNINLKVLYLYCDLASVKQRIQRRLTQKGVADVFTIEAYLKDAIRYDFPSETEYTPLPIDTSDESPIAEERRRNEIHAFLTGNFPISQQELAARLVHAQTALQEIKKSA